MFLLAGTVQESTLLLIFVINAVTVVVYYIQSRHKAWCPLKHLAHVNVKCIQEKKIITNGNILSQSITIIKSPVRNVLIDHNAIIVPRIICFNKPNTTQLHSSKDPGNPTKTTNKLGIPKGLLLLTIGEHIYPAYCHKASFKLIWKHQTFQSVH